MILCIVYISSPSSALLKLVLSNKLSSKLVHSFEDVTYNRTSYFFMESLSNTINFKNSILDFCAKAYETIDYTQHTGTHPTLGTCDHLCISPMGESTIEDILPVAKELADVFQTKFDVPVYRYGALSDSHEKLSQIRKQLGYFNSNCSDVADTKKVDVRKGVTCMGVVPFVLNYNIRFSPNSTKDQCIQVTKYVRSSEVESLTLPHEGGSFETACNLLNSKMTGPSQVLEKAQTKAKELELEIVKDYTTGPSEAELITAYRAAVTASL